MTHRQCRICNAITDTDFLVKYGTRHYAHFTCYLDSGHRLDDLTAWQVGRFPYQILLVRDLMDRATEITRQSAVAKLRTVTF